MRFRITHLLVIAVFVAVFATAFARASFEVALLLKTVAWLAYGLLAVFALSRHGRERLVACSALVLGLSYAGFIWASGNNTFFQIVLRQLCGRLFSEELYSDINAHRIAIGHIAFSFFFAFVAGALAAYWSRPRTSMRRGG
jgi:hypothetical protein